MRHAFAVLFFVSVGMLLDPGALTASPGLLAAALAIVLVGKPLVAFVLVWAMRYPFRTSLTVGVALAQIGEFSFILAILGRQLGILTVVATNVLVATAMASIVLNPVAYRTIGSVERYLRGMPRLWTRLNRDVAAPGDLQADPVTRAVDPSHRAVVVGYGPTGRAVVGLLRSNGMAPTVIELNVDVVRGLRDAGIDAVYGDATRLDTLEVAGVSRAGSLILGSAGMANGTEVIRMARGLNPRIRVLARAAYLRDVPDLKNAGADSVYSGEGEVALAFIEDLLAHLGATAEQIDRERERAHAELFSDAPPSTRG
jgi:CPA2 family monovalent cation:H+ antiporter-2